MRVRHPGVAVRFGVLAVGTMPMGRLSVQMVHVARLLEIPPASRNVFYREILTPVYKAAEEIERDHRRSYYRRSEADGAAASGAAAAKASAAKKQRGAETQRAAAARGTSVDGDYTVIHTLGTHRMVGVAGAGAAAGERGGGACSTCPRQSPSAACTWCGACFACGREAPCPGQHATPQTSEAELFEDDDVDKGFAAPGEEC